MGIKDNIKKLLSVLPWVTIKTSKTSAAPTDEEAIWQQVYDVRSTFYEDNFGPLPNDILKMMNLTGVWSGGGLYVIPANKLKEGLWVYTTFGLTNLDMPTGVTVTNSATEVDEQGRNKEFSTTLQRKEQVQCREDAAGYGYEMLLITNENTQWPLWFMQWAANAEILHDAAILERVEQHQGLTIENIEVGENDSINVLITKTRNPLATGLELPNGSMDLLIATVITNKEMQWSIENGREALLEKLISSNVGQISYRNRDSIID